MTRVLVIGTGPLFTPEVRQFNGQALRTWHLARPLWNHGHDVDLVVLAAEGVPVGEQPGANTVQRTLGSVPYLSVETNDPAVVARELQWIHDARPHDCIVAINHNAAIFACKLLTRLPIWADLNGYMMGEAQTKGIVYESDQYLCHFWQRQRTVLRRADRFSAVSYKQMYATLGELGAVGRLNRFTASHPFVSVIPNAVFEGFLDPGSYPKEARYRGKVFPSDAFAVLWSGGFNTWTDGKSLAAALSLAMEQDPRIRFVATGAEIAGHDDRTYQSFVAEMERTGFADRCHLLGWVEASELFSLYKECDLGINVDALNYETLFGARNRLTNMMGAGLPVLTTLGTEISEIIEENRLGYVVRLGEVQQFADAILSASRKPVERQTYARRAREYSAIHFSYEATTRSLMKWVGEAALAPDNAEKALRWPESTDLVACALNPLEEQINQWEGHDLDGLLRAQSDLASIRSKRLFRLYKRLFK